MTRRFSAGPAVAAVALCAAFPCHSLAAATKADWTFAGKVGQGGRCEILASRFVESKASAPDVKDIAITEVHDHSGVNRNLKQISDLRTSDGSDRKAS